MTQKTEAEQREHLQADLVAGKVSIYGDHLVVDVNQCTCGAGKLYPHEPQCGIEPLGKIVDLVLGAPQPEPGDENDIVARFDRWAAKPRTGSISQTERYVSFAHELRDALVALREAS